MSAGESICPDCLCTPATFCTDKCECHSVPLPVYRGTVIYVCPGCDGDLQHEGDGFWCPACRQSWSFTQVGVYEDEDPHDD